MQPQYPSPAPPPVIPTGNGQPKYDFIFDNKTAGKKPLLPGGGSKKGRLIIVGAGAVILILLIVLVARLISNAGKGDTSALVTAAKQQQELIRVADIGIDKAKSQAAKNIAITTKLALESQQKEMQSAITTAGLNPKKVLISSKNTKTDSTLTTAEQNNRFDEEFLNIMSTSLTEYQKTIKTAYEGATSKKLKAALTTQYKSANVLAGVASQID